MKSTQTRLYTAKEAARYLGVSLATLNRVEKGGFLVPFRTHGGHRRYSKAMLDEYLESNKERWIKGNVSR
jgi:excisionase family DNA binding protein